MSFGIRLGSVLAAILLISRSSFAMPPAPAISLDDQAKALSLISVDSTGQVTNGNLTVDELSAFLQNKSGFSEPNNGSGSHVEDSIPRLFGDFPRTQVTETSELPHRAFGLIDIGCTGTLIGPREVLTAGHCIFDIDRNKWLSGLAFTPARDGDNRPYPKVDWERAYTVRGWVEGHDSHYDFAVVILKSAVGLETGWLSFAFDNALPLSTITVEGYPGDKPEGTLWSSTCPMNSLEKGFIAHSCDTFGGNSGSAITIDSGNSRVIYGIHTDGLPKQNRGIRITGPIFHTIDGIRNHEN